MKSPKSKTKATAKPETGSGRAPRRTAAENRLAKVLRAAGAPAPKGNKKGVTAAPSPVLPTMGNIRLDLSNLTVSQLLAMVHLIRDGLTGNIYYPNLTGDVDSLTAAENTLLSMLNSVSSLEAQLKNIRAALVNESVTVKDLLKAVATACENEDRSDEALVSVGWQLKKGRSPSRPVTVATGLVSRPTGFPGTIAVRWGRVDLAKFYEIQYVQTASTETPYNWDTDSRMLSGTRVTQDIAGLTPGAIVNVRVRAIGSKGPGPWSTPITPLVN
jgi:hypothetical protein